MSVILNPIMLRSDFPFVTSFEIKEKEEIGGRASRHFARLNQNFISFLFIFIYRVFFFLDLFYSADVV